MRRAAAIFVTIITLAAFMISCGGKGSVRTADNGNGHRLPDTLRVATLYSPLSYFLYRGEPMGIDYTLADSLARQKGMVLDLSVARSLAEAVAPQLTFMSCLSIFICRSPL